MPEYIVEGEDLGDWSLLVQGDDVVAVRTVPHDGQLYYSTEDKPNRAHKNSEFQLDAREVVRRFAAKSDTDRGFGELIDDVQVALAGVV
jgi:hypothetical protein